MFYMLRGAPDFRRLPSPSLELRYDVKRCIREHTLAIYACSPHVGPNARLV